MRPLSRRSFLRSSLVAGAGLYAAGLGSSRRLSAAEPPGSELKFGLVTYLWGQDWDLPTLIANCEKTNVLGVELRTEHAHGVEPELSPSERAEVRKRFADSPVVCLGPGTNEHFDSADPAAVRKCIERTKQFIQLSAEIGASGVKVKPNDLPPNVPQEQTIAQIGRSLNEVGRFAAEHGQEIRLEVHGKCAPLPIIKQIMEVADHPAVGVCWNCNAQDLEGDGIEHNFRLVQDRFGETVHVRELDGPEYPYPKLFELLVGMDYAGWVLLEARGKPDDRVAALAAQRDLFASLVKRAQAKV